MDGIYHVGTSATTLSTSSFVNAQLIISFTASVA